MLIHFGPSCLSPSQSIPVLWIFGRASLDIADCCEKIKQVISQEEECNRYVLMFDTQYDHIIGKGFLNRMLLHFSWCGYSDILSPHHSSFISLHIISLSYIIIIFVLIGVVFSFT